MLGQLVPRGGGDPIPLLKPKLLVGRREHCDIVLSFPNISSQHCEFEFSEGYWRVRDLNSKNGIKVNGDRCTQKWLMPGDTVRIGKQHEYEIQYEPQGTSPPPEVEEDVLGRSLLEKAGLERGPSRRPAPRPVRPAAPPPVSGKPDPDEDEALKWLTEE